MNGGKEISCDTSPSATIQDQLALEAQLSEVLCREAWHAAVQKKWLPEDGQALLCTIVVW